MKDSGFRVFSAFFIWREDISLSASEKVKEEKSK